MLVAEEGRWTDEAGRPEELGRFWRNGKIEGAFGRVGCSDLSLVALGFGVPRRVALRRG